MDTSTFGPEAQFAFARSASYGLLANIFHYPNESLIENLRSAERWTTWPDYLKGRNPVAFDALTDLREFALDAPPLVSLLKSYIGLFGHGVRGACPAYELEYDLGEIVQKAPQLSDIAGFYNAFGMEMSSASDERHDHVSIETEFMSHAAAKECHAIGRCDSDGLEIIRTAEGKFLDEHLGHWLPSFARRIYETDGGGFYGLAANFARALVVGDCETFGAVPGLKMLELRPTNQESETIMECGPEEGCAGCSELTPESAEA